MYVRVPSGCLLPHTVSRAPFVCKSHSCRLTLCPNGRFPFRHVLPSLRSLGNFDVHLHFPSCALCCGPIWRLVDGPEAFHSVADGDLSEPSGQLPRITPPPPVPGLCSKVRQRDLPTVGLLAPRTAATHSRLLSVLDVTTTLPLQSNLLLVSNSIRGRHSTMVRDTSLKVICRTRAAAPGHLVSDSLFPNKW